jgi:hypothetical protein
VGFCGLCISVRDLIKNLNVLSSESDKDTLAVINRL